MATKINNLECDASLEVRYWRHPAEKVTVHEVENGTVYTAEVCTDGSNMETALGQQALYLWMASWYTNWSLNGMDTAPIIKQSKLQF